MDNDKIKNDMWNDKIKGTCGICMICSECGGSSAAYCMCARSKYINSLTESDIKEYLKKKNQKQ